MDKIELIDRAAVMDAMYDNEFQTFCPLDEVSAVIAAVPTIDAAPVRRGEWERYNLTALGTGIEWYRLRCSECKLMPVGDVRNWNFCPNCGADMRGKSE